MTSKKFSEWSRLNRDEFYAIALSDSGSPALAEFATVKLYDSGFITRQSKKG